MRKKRVLLVNEFHQLATGYAVYGKEVMTRLHQTGKYELAELACYVDPNDPRALSAPWKVYGNFPANYQQGFTGNRNQEEVNYYEGAITNEFGGWKFEHVCLDFLPDIVFMVRDWWMDEFVYRSPFRRFYKIVHMPTVDSEPQNEDWIATYTESDGIFCYSNWSTELLKEQGGDLIKTIGHASPAVDYNTFKPVVFKSEHKQRFGFDPNCLFIGTVMRNQKRKLYPDLFEAFADLLEKSPISDRLNLVCHTSYPDLGWKISSLVKKLGVSNRIYFTYVCRNCGLVQPMLYQDVRAICPKCRTPNLSFPSTQMGLDNPALAAVVNLFDCFVQYSIAEGFGMPQVEAAACGVPLFSVDYSAMADVVRKLKGYPIEVERFSYESETGCKRAFPKNEDLVVKLRKFLEMPESMRNKKRMETRELCLTEYSWDKTAKKWEDAIDLFATPEGNPWIAQPQMHNPPPNFPSPEQMMDAQFVDWAIVNVLGQPQYIGSYMSMRLLRDLLWEAYIPGFGGFLYDDASTLGMKPKYQRFNREELVKKLREMREMINRWEQTRWEKVLRGEIK